MRAVYRMWPAGRSSPGQKAIARLAPAMRAGTSASMTAAPRVAPTAMRCAIPRRPRRGLRPTSRPRPGCDLIVACRLIRHDQQQRVGMYFCARKVGAFRQHIEQRLPDLPVASLLAHAAELAEV